MPSIINATTTNGVAISPDNSGSLQLATNNGTTAVTIDTSQRVGIGLTPVSQKLEVNGNQRLIGDSAYILWRNTADSSSSGVIQFSSSSAATIGTYVNQPILFQTNNTERMRIDSNGNLLIGKTATGAADYNGVQLYPNGTNSAVTASDTSTTGPLFYFVNRGATVTNGYRFVTFRATSSFTEVGTITTNGSSTTAYNTSSDYRLKENIAPMIGALDKVAQLKPCTYTWKVDGSNGQGFIAHELQSVVPDAVTGEKDAVETYTDEEGNEQTRPVYQGVDTSFLVATLTAAIQEQQAMIEELKQEVQLLKNPPVEGTE